ncbi:hypothetical protein BGZ94_000203 [Podila epigama]|nr:hypothetical protein BGZ94_000203 [Podila epigama]
MAAMTGDNQELALDGSIAMPMAPTVSMMPGGHPMFTRSISAPHIYLSGVRDNLPNSQDYSHDYTYHAHPMQRFNSTLSVHQQPHSYPGFYNAPHPFDPCPFPQQQPPQPPSQQQQQPQPQQLPHEQLQLQQHPSLHMNNTNNINNINNINSINNTNTNNNNNLNNMNNNNNSNNNTFNATNTASNTSFFQDSNAFTYAQPVHPFQMDQMTYSINTLDVATATRSKPEQQLNDGFNTLTSLPTPSSYLVNFLDDPQGSSAPSSASCSPTAMATQGDSFSTCDTLTSSPSQSPGQCPTLPLSRSSMARFELPEEYPPYLFPRHGSLDSLYPLTVFHNQLESSPPPYSLLPPSEGANETNNNTSVVEGGTPMATSSSSRSISSSASTPPTALSRARIRRASTSTDIKVYPCIFDYCNRSFKRSEHLKRHVRSVHTQEKPFLCPFDACPKRFSRSDNLNQHIRIHRHEKEKLPPTTFSHFTPVDA